MMKEKLTYSIGEKVFEILSALLAVGTTVGYVMMAAEKGSSVILLVVSLIIYAALTLCSFFPQHTNIAYEPERCTERNLRLIRRGCIMAKIVLIALMFITTAV